MMKLTALLIPAVLLVGCGASHDEGQPETEAGATYEAVHTAAVAAIDAAAAKGHAWSTSDTLLAQARAAMDAGDEARALELASEARLQAEIALAQAEFEADAWRGRVIGN